MTPKCNQTGCDNPAAFRYTWPGQDDENGICAEHAPHVRLVAGALGCNIPLIPLKEPADQPDPEAVKCKNEVLCVIEKSNGLHEDECTAIISRYLQKARGECEAYKVENESRAIWIAKMNKILGYDNSDGFHSTPDPFEIAATLTAKAEGFERLAAECDVLKDTNDKLRDQLCANTKLISELQHTVRLVQETHSQQVHECAVKASGALVDKFYGQGVDYAFRTKIEAIICEAFDAAPVKDEWLIAWEKEWASLPGEENEYGRSTHKAGFKAAWKLAKGDK